MASNSSLGDAQHEKVLKSTLEQIDRQFGKGSIMRLGQEALERVPGIPTGSISLDMALGGTGIPRGRVIEIFGPEASGKTTAALHVVASAQRKGGVAAFVDAEHALDPSYAKRLDKSIEEYTSLGQAERAEALQSERAIVAEFMPKQLGPEETEALVDGTLAEHADLTARDIGKAMKLIMAEHRGEVDGKLVNELVRRKLAER